MTCHRRTLLACAALGALSAALPAAAQDSWPTKTVRLIVPYAAGGFADTRARKIADALGKTLGQPVIVDNRAGAGGVTGTDAIAKATDGHTFGFGSPAPLVTNPMLMKKMPYDAEKAFKPIILIETAPLFLSTAPNQSFKSLKELLDHARANPGKLTYGSSGVGGAHHLSAELLAHQTKTETTHVPYKGGALAANDLMGGHLAFMFEMGYSALPAIQAGKIKALAVTSARPSPLLPGVPAMAETIKGFEVDTWWGLVAPAGTPREVVDRLNAAFTDALKAPETQQRFAQLMAEPVPTTPEQFGQFMARERARYEPVVKRSGAKVD